MELTKNKAVLDWIDQQVKLTQPKEVIWIDGSEAQLEELRKEACATGEIYKLNQEKLPGCYLHRSDPSDVARVESRTFICCKKQEDAGPTNNWMDPEKAYKMLSLRQVRHRADRFHLCGAEHGHHDPRGHEGRGLLRRKLHQGPPRQGDPGSRRAVYRSIP